MNRIEFTKTINANNFESSLKKYFDQIMSLYGVLHEYEFKSIDNDNTLFTIRFKNNEYAQGAYQNIPGVLTMYDRCFYVSKSINKNNISIEMREYERE